MGYYGFWFIVGIVFWIWVMGLARYLRFQAVQLVCVLFFVMWPTNVALTYSVLLMFVWIALEVYFYRRKRQEETVVLDLGGARTFTQPLQPQPQQTVHTSQPQQTVIINHHHHYHEGAGPTAVSPERRLD